MAILSNGCVKHASSHAYTSVKPLTANGEKDAWRGTEAPAVLLEPFHLTLGSKSLQINVSPLRTGSSHHHGRHRDPSAGAGATHAFHSAVKRCHLPSSEPVMPRSRCAPLPSGAGAQRSPGWQQHPLLWPGLASARPRDTHGLCRSEQNVAPSRNRWLQGYQTPYEDTDQTNSCSSANWIYTFQSSNLYLSTRIGHVAFVATACVRPNLFRQRSVASDRHLLNIFTYWTSGKTPSPQIPQINSPKISPNDKRWGVQDLNSQLQNAPRKNKPSDT